MAGLSRAIEVSVVLIVGVASVFTTPEVSRAATTKTCLTGTDPSVSGDAAQIDAVRSLIDTSCVCGDYDGSTGRTHSAYVRCATTLINAQASVPPGGLRAQCKATVRRYYAQSTCGTSPALQAEPCIRRSARTGKLTCSIKPLMRRDGLTPSGGCANGQTFTQVSCPIYTTCIDAADTNGDRIIAAPADSGACTPGGVLDRPADPVVLTGGDVPSLTGIAPSLLVAFHYASGWVQIPVQVDERDVINFSNVYNNTGSYGGGFTRLDYTDSSTFTGADSDPNLDSNDDIVFMARDAGAVAPVAAADPAGVASGTGRQVQVVDPLPSGGVGYVYLFRQNGSLDPTAGQNYVNYQFTLNSGNYLTTYQLGAGPNPENTAVTTPSYAVHFADRWIRDQMQIFAGGATGVDILDRHKDLFSPGACVRSEDTFSSGEGAFIVNKNGPVRALRSYVGANSGPRTQRQHIFYDRREDVTTFLRVHAIPGILDFFDYSSAATGMIYRNTQNTAGVPIDGNPETINTNPYDWELVTGAQGSLTMASSLQVDFALTNFQAYYLDDTTPPDTQCTGDSFAYGSSGLRVNQTVPATDPWTPPFSNLTAVRVIFYDSPGLTTADGVQRRDWVSNPLTHSVSAGP